MNIDYIDNINNIDHIERDNYHENIDIEIMIIKIKSEEKFLKLSNFYMSRNFRQKTFSQNFK